MTNHRSVIVVGVAFAAIAIIAVAWHFYQTGWRPVTIEPSIAIERTNQDVVPLYDLFEADLRVEANFESSFDSEEVNVTAIFTSPGGRVTVIPAFYYQEYNRSLLGNDEELSPFGDPYWKVRFSPTELGEYTFHARLEDEGQVATTGQLAFSVSPSESRGFVRLSDRDSRYFRFDDDSSFIFVGHDVCWFGDRGTYDYDTYFSSMNLNGETITRIWMAPWAFGIEWKDLDRSAVRYG